MQGIGVFLNSGCEQLVPLFLWVNVKVLGTQIRRPINVLEQALLLLAAEQRNLTPLA